MRVVSFAIIVILFVSCKKENWKLHKEKINVGFTIEYSIPGDWFSNRIENGMCIGAKAKSEEDEMKLIKESWCIWMYNPEQESVELQSDISYFKSQTKGQVKETKSSIKIAGSLGQKVTLESTDGAFKEMIYFRKFKTLFIINNTKRGDNEFVKFYNSIKVF